MLSNKEQEVMQWVMQGLQNKEVATKMNISIKTVENHLQSIYKKLGVTNRTQATVRLIKQGFQ